ncbi:MAG TPA: TetR/AcrR family transcriptional regulator [Acidimicrobiales bacterium]|jgi:AcrR family transcriptional regulator|nr:TetR/AcrR family transcriptional regulator [Acidimicrobiales bacterium]
MTGPLAQAVLTGAQAERRQRAIDAGLALLRRGDYAQIQVKDVAEEAGVALGTLYNYFSSKEHLFAEVLVQWAATLRASLAHHPLDGATPQEQLTQALHRSVRAFQHQPQLARLVSTLQMSSDPFATEILLRLDQATRGVYLEILQDFEPAHAQRIIRAASAVFDSLLRSWSAGRLSTVDLYDYLTDSVSLLFASAGDDRELMAARGDQRGRS